MWRYYGRYNIYIYSCEKKKKKHQQGHALWLLISKFFLIKNIMVIREG